jgi:hypothetical protein
VVPDNKVAVLSNVTLLKAGLASVRRPTNHHHLVVQQLSVLPVLQAQWAYVAPEPKAELTLNAKKILQNQAITSVRRLALAQKESSVNAVLLRTLLLVSLVIRKPEFVFLRMQSQKNQLTPGVNLVARWADVAMASKATLPNLTVSPILLPMKISAPILVLVPKESLASAVPAHRILLDSCATTRSAFLRATSLPQTL